jgi:hypothetical protein
MEEKLLAVRKRLRDDFGFYASKCVKIRTKQGDIRTLEFNPVQKKLEALVKKQVEATGQARVIILKARQQGLSTYTSGRLYFRLSQLPAKKGLVVAHKSDSTRTLFDMYRRIHAEMPEAVRPSRPSTPRGASWRSTIWTRR